MHRISRTFGSQGRYSVAFLSMEFEASPPGRLAFPCAYPSCLAVFESSHVLERHKQVHFIAPRPVFGANVEVIDDDRDSGRPRKKPRGTLNLTKCARCRDDKVNVHLKPPDAGSCAHCMRVQPITPHR